MIVLSHIKTRKCIYRESCEYCNTPVCIDNKCGCLKYGYKMEEAENP